MKRQLLAAVFAGTLLLPLTACGGGSDTPATSPSPAESPAASPTGSPAASPSAAPKSP